MTQVLPLRSRISFVRLVSGCVIGIGAAAASAQHSPFQAAIVRFEARLAADVAKDGVGAISAAVVAGDRVVWARGFGWADVEKRRPADTARPRHAGAARRFGRSPLATSAMSDVR